MPDETLKTELKTKLAAIARLAELDGYEDLAIAAAAALPRLMAPPAPPAPTSARSKPPTAPSAPPAPDAAASARHGPPERSEILAEVAGLCARADGSGWTRTRWIAAELGTSSKPLMWVLGRLCHEGLLVRRANPHWQLGKFEYQLSPLGHDALNTRDHRAQRGPVMTVAKSEASAEPE